MKRTKTLVAVILAVMFVLAIGLAACNQHVCKHVCPECNKCTDKTCTDPACADKCTCFDIAELTYAKGTTLRMATGYNSTATGIAFDADTISKKGKDGSITLADGKTYRAGDLKPTWVELQNKLDVVFENKYQGKKASEEWAYWKEQLKEVDMLSGTAELLNDAGVAGSLINIADYLDVMPNFKAYLEANPIVRLSITGSTQGSTKGAIYFSPYFDGVNDIERMPLMRADMVIALLDGEEAYTGANRNVNTSAYTPYMPTSGTVSIESLNATGTATQTIVKDYNAYGNIIAKMNAETNLTGDKAVAMFRQYIDATYGDTYANRSDLFLGYDAAWDADELVALLRCAVASLNDNDGNAISGLFSRQTDSVQRQVDLFRFAGTLLGARGMESRQDYLYIGNDGKLHDARQEVASYQAMEKLNQMYREGLIIMTGSAKSDDYLAKDAGIVSYDYSQTQTIMNETKLQDGEKYTPAMVPVARWNDGTGETYMRFTESWRSVKTDGWAISKAGIGYNKEKLCAALKLIDYAYSKEGQILMSYGPDAFIKTNADGSYVTFDFNGQQWPEIADKTREELMKLANGSYTDYARQFLGSTLSFIKSQSFEFQCTHEVGREGAGKISVAIAKGTIKHPELAVSTNKWYMSVPTVLPNTKQESDLIKTYTELAGDNSQFSQSNKKINKFLEMIVDGYGAFKADLNITDATSAVNVVKTTWNGTQYLKIKQDGMDRLLTFYNEINK